MNLPEKMRFIDVPVAGDATVLRLAETLLPEVRAGEVLIQVTAAGVNRADLLQRAGKYPPPPDASPVLGLEASGAIVALGEGVSSWKIGDRVCSLTPGGAYAEYVRTPHGQCLPIPSGVSEEEAAVLPEAAMTVWSNVFDRGRLKAGETLLVHGGTSGIGATAIQYAAQRGAVVYATAGTPEKCAAALALGAKGAINHRSDDFVKTLLDQTSGHGADVVLDIIGGEYTQRNIEALATEGRIVQIAFQKGNRVQIDLAALSRKRGWITGSFLRPRSIDEKTAIANALRREIWPLYERKNIRPKIEKVFPFSEAVAAHQHLEEGDHIGKIVLSWKPK